MADETAGPAEHSAAPGDDRKCPQCAALVHADSWIRHAQWHAVLDERLGVLEVRVTSLEEMERKADM